MSDNSHRMLAAIMFADMVGYTALMQEDEARAMALRTRCRDVLKASVAAHGGRILQFYGDGTLSTFGSAIEASRCAVEVQRKLMQEPRVPLRVGVHVGDVVHDAEGVYGDAVNVASRIQALAIAGGVCVSDKVYDEIKNQPGLETVSLGSHRLKNVKRPVEVYALAGGDLAVPEVHAAGPVRAVIVDDEELARRVLKEYLVAHPEVQVVAECANGFEAVKAVTELKPDLLFLDIQMPKLNGFEVLELIDKNLAVVFVTAYDEFALRAFEVHAVDYLLKPFSKERLAAAIDRARERIGHPTQAGLTGLVQAVRPQGKHAERVLVRDGARVHVIPVEKIDYVEAQDDYVCFVTEGKKFLKQTTLSELEKELAPDRFVRIHRSFILNIERLSKIELYAKDSRVAILTDGSRLQVSRAGYAKLKQFL